MKSGEMIPNRFTTYFLTEDDRLTGSVFNMQQKQVIQNLLSTHAQEKNTLSYDVANPHTFIQEESFHKGAIKVLEYILDKSDAAERILNGVDEEPSSF